MASEKKAGFDIPKKYYLIKTGNRLRKVHPRLVTTTNMPLLDLPLFFVGLYSRSTALSRR
ncbi:MAG: hypothetical protein NT022_11155 [Deltaproteobacteria bacterium]|nr:hypothetical protein [Deltaproteobacteria bacterium]